MTGALVRGGMEMQFLDLAREHKRRGGELVTIGDDGPLEDVFSEFGSFVRVPHPFEDQHQNVETILSEITSNSICAIALQSSYFSLIPILSMRSRVLICAHNRPGTFENWLQPQSLSRLGELFRALEADGHLQISASSRSNAERHAESFGLLGDTVQAWYPAIGETSIEEPRIRSSDFIIGVVTRLSPEKLLLVEAALVLLDSALSQGANARLNIAGSGGAKSAFEECIERSGLSSHVDFIGESTDPVTTCRGFDVTVANGRVALEALAAGSRLVTVSVEQTDRHDLRLHSVVNLDNVEYLANENFAPPLADGEPSKIWSDVINIKYDTRIFLRDWIFKARSTSVLYNSFMNRMRKVTADVYNSNLEELLSRNQAHDDAILAPVLRHNSAAERHRAAFLEDELMKAHEWTKEQREAIDWLADQRDIWESKYKNLSNEIADIYLKLSH